MPLNGCGIWNERPMPRQQRRSGARWVMSMPARMTRPASGATVPLAIPNSVVLPAPFGPMMPSASPSARARSSARATTTAPKRLEIFSKARMAGMQWSSASAVALYHASAAPPLIPAKAGIQSRRRYLWVPAFAGTSGVDCDCRKRGGVELRQQLQLAAHGNLRRGLVGGDDQVEAVALALPLSGDERRLGDVLDGLAGPLHRADHRFGIGRAHRIEYRFRLHRLRALVHVYGDLEQRVLEADRLRPRPFGCVDVGVGEFLRALPGETGLERMVWRPPDFRGEAVAACAERIDHRREQQRLADGHDLRAEALLRRLRPEGGEVGRDHVAGDNLGID